MSILNQSFYTRGVPVLNVLLKSTSYRILISNDNNNYNLVCESFHYFDVCCIMKFYTDSLFCILMLSIVSEYAVYNISSFTAV